MLSRISATKTLAISPRRGPCAQVRRIARVRRITTRARRGATATEAVISAVLLGLTVVAVGKFANMTHEGLRERELSARIDWELTNARELIGSWAPVQVTEANVESIVFSAPLQQHFEDLAWDAEVEEIEKPIAALQVRLSLNATRKSQAIRPADLTFWVPRGISMATNSADALDDRPMRVESGQTGADSKPSEDDEQSASGSDGGGS